MATDEDLLAAEWESVSDSSTDDSNQPANDCLLYTSDAADEE